jgi:nitrate reductase gamma subunit
MSAGIALVAVIILLAIGTVAGFVGPLQFVFGVIIPYVAVATFVVGFIVRVVQWAKLPVPYRIPTTAGQMKSFDYIKSNELDNPSGTLGVIGRMALEVFLFRSLLRNTRTEVREQEDGPKVVYNSNLWLWGFGLAFHWAFLIVLVRHMRFFSEPVPFFINWIDYLDSIVELGVPAIYLTDFAFVGGVTYVFFRRLVVPQIRYISLPGDYFPLFLLMGIGITGCLMRYWPGSRVNIEGVKDLGLGLIGFDFALPADPIGGMFYVHFVLVCALAIYFPFSKLMHMGGVFFSPTRNMANNNRVVRHVSPQELVAHPHTYAEYEDEFRATMEKVGLPVDKPSPKPAAEEK